jgi:DNA-binding winged helix-turn-helix (wHTH) protein
LQWFGGRSCLHLVISGVDDYTSATKKWVVMAPSVQTSSVLRFGVFEVDLRSGELRKQGFRIRVQEQPLRVLIVLLQRPGEVVAREDLRALIWPADTFVDFDNSLNTSINKLREALGDSAENPRFIETLPRRGYRFIAPVVIVGATEDVEHPPGLVPSSAAPTHLSTVGTAPSLWIWIFALMVVAGVTGAVAFWRRPTALPRVTGSSQITHDGLPRGTPS